MNAVVIDLDSKRKKQWEHLHCLFCHRQEWREVVPKRQYYPCPGGCDEEAAVPVWSLSHR